MKLRMSSGVALSKGLLMALRNCARAVSYAVIVFAGYERWSVRWSENCSTQDLDGECFVISLRLTHSRRDSLALCRARHFRGSRAALPRGRPVPPAPGRVLSAPAETW